MMWKLEPRAVYRVGPAKLKLNCHRIDAHEVLSFTAHQFLVGLKLEQRRRFVFTLKEKQQKKITKEHNDANHTTTDLHGFSSLRYVYGSHRFYCAQRAGIKRVHDIRFISVVASRYVFKGFRIYLRGVESM